VTRWRLRPLSIVLTVAVFVASAATASADSQPTFIGTGANLTFSGNQGRTTFQILNPGREAQGTFVVKFLPSGASFPALPKHTPLQANGVTTVSVAIRTGFHTSLTGATLVMTTDATASRTTRSEGAGDTSHAATSTASSSTSAPVPQTLTLTLVRQTRWWMFVGPLVIGLIVMLGSVALITSRDGKAIAASGWNFSDSIATNVTAIGGLLAAALAAFGSSSTLLPAVQTDRISLLNALWAAVAIISPVFVGARTDATSVVSGPEGHKTTKPQLSLSLQALRGAVALIILAAVAQLTTLEILVFMTTLAGFAKAGAAALLVAAGITLVAYVVKTTNTLIEASAEHPTTGLNLGDRTSLLP
jgi:hypothetical protein